MAETARRVTAFSFEKSVATFFCFSAFFQRTFTREQLCHHCSAHAPRTPRMIEFTVFKQGRERCAALTEILSRGGSSVARISDAYNVASSLCVPGIEQDGENIWARVTHVSVCAHCLGSIRGQCCTSCRKTENDARKSFKGRIVPPGSAEKTVQPVDDIFRTAAIVQGFVDFLRRRQGLSTHRHSWIESILHSFHSNELQGFFEVLSCACSDSEDFLLSTLDHSKISVLEGVHVWSPVLIGRLFGDNISTFISQPPPPSTKEEGVEDEEEDEPGPNTPDIDAAADTTAVHDDIDMYFSDLDHISHNPATFLENELEVVEPTIEIVDHAKTRERLRHECSRNVDSPIILRDIRRIPRVFKRTYRDNHFRQFMKDVVMLPVQKKFKNPTDQRFLDEYFQTRFEFTFDLSRYGPKKIISFLLLQERFLAFVKSIVPPRIDCLEEAFRYVNNNLLTRVEN